MKNSARTTERGSIMLVVVTAVGVLMALTVALFSIVLSSHQEKNAQDGHDTALNVSEMAVEMVAAQIASTALTTSADNQMYGLERGSMTVPFTGQIDGNDYRAELRSAYFTRLNSESPTFMSELEEQRADPTDPLFDVYQLKAASSAVVGPELTLARGAEIVYAIKKNLVVPSALYIDDTSPEIDSDTFEIDGSDHSMEKPETEIKIIRMPYNGTINLPDDIPYPEAGLHSGLFYTNPEDGAEVLVFDDGHEASSTFDGGYFGQDPDDSSALPTEFSRNSPLDLFIRTYADSWGLGTYDHHIFGHQYRNPGHENDGKAFGTVFWQKVHLRDDVTTTDLQNQFLAANPDIAVEYPGLKIDPDGDGIIATEEDFTGDGIKNYERDMDGNGEISMWHRGQWNEDTNGNGQWDNDDFVLGEKIRNFLITTHENEEEHTAGDNDGRYPIIDQFDVRVGWEDLPGYLDWNDWDFDDLILTLELRPQGGGSESNDDWIFAPTYLIPGRGVPAIGCNVPFGQLGLDEARRYDYIHSSLEDSEGNVAPVAGYEACKRLVEPFDCMAFAASYVGGTRAAFEPRGDLVLNTDSLALGGPDDFHTYFIDNQDSFTHQLNAMQIGYGVLVVTGDLTITPPVTWYGAIVVLGNLTIEGRGGTGVHVFGSVMCQGDFSMTGNSYIWYCSEALKRCFRQLSPSVTVYAEKKLWRELSPAEIADLGM
jgi:hypothetical protein